MVVMAEPCTTLTAFAYDATHLFRAELTADINKRLAAVPGQLLAILIRDR